MKTNFHLFSDKISNKSCDGSTQNHCFYDFRNQHSFSLKMQKQIQYHAIKGHYSNWSQTLLFTFHLEERMVLFILKTAKDIPGAKTIKTKNSNKNKYFATGSIMNKDSFATKDLD